VSRKEGIRFEGVCGSPTATVTAKQSHHVSYLGKAIDQHDGISIVGQPLGGLVVLAVGGCHQDAHVARLDGWQTPFQRVIVLFHRFAGRLPHQGATRRRTTGQQPHGGTETGHERRQALDYLPTSREIGLVDGHGRTERTVAEFVELRHGGKLALDQTKRGRARGIYRGLDGAGGLLIAG